MVDEGLENLEEVATERGVEDVFVQKFKKLFQNTALERTGRVGLLKNLKIPQT